MKIPFNIPCTIGNELSYVAEAIQNGHLGGNGPFTKRVHKIFEQEAGFGKVFLTSSCTDALEMAAIMCNFQDAEEVILPSFTHVATANAFERAGAELVFADSLPEHPNMDPRDVAKRITSRTRAIVIVHYAGVAADMDAYAALASAHDLILIEDAAHAIDAKYKNKALGAFGTFATYSFHETKNITCGQGGLLIINDPKYVPRAARLWENGTNRAEFYAGEADHYTWVDTGSCFLPSDMNAAYLYGQLLKRKAVLHRRMELWERYWTQLTAIGPNPIFELPVIPADRQHNGHIFYLHCQDRKMRDMLLEYLNENDINAVFHYIPLHSSPHFKDRHQGRSLPNCDLHSASILRLPIYFNLEDETVDRTCELLKDFVHKH